MRGLLGTKLAEAFEDIGFGQQVDPNGANRVWAGDLTYLPKQGGGWRYLATWLDRYSRKVVEWDGRESMPADLVREALRRARAIRQPAAGLVVHSDQGSQDTATHFKTLLAHHEAVQSRSRRGNGNAYTHAESFWIRFKAEFLASGSFRNVSEAQLESSHSLAYYNAEHRHSGLAISPPITSKSPFKSCPNSVQLSQTTSG